VVTNLKLGKLVVRPREQGLAFFIKDSVTSLADIAREDIPLVMTYLKSYLEEQGNRRSSFRLNLSELHPRDYQNFRVALVDGEGHGEVHAIDFSLSGLLIQTEYFAGQIGDHVKVQLEFEGCATVMTALVVRVSAVDGQVALRFPDAYLDDGSLEPPAELATIFHAVEGRWLEKCLKLQWNDQ
jgi:hypothetical protein